MISRTTLLSCNYHEAECDNTEYACSDSSRILGSVIELSASCSDGAAGIACSSTGGIGYANLYLIADDASGSDIISMSTVVGVVGRLRYISSCDIYSAVDRGIVCIVRVGSLYGSLTCLFAKNSAGSRIIGDEISAIAFYRNVPCGDITEFTLEICLFIRIVSSDLQMQLGCSISDLYIVRTGIELCGEGAVRYNYIEYVGIANIVSYGKNRLTYINTSDLAVSIYCSNGRIIGVLILNREGKILDLLLGYSSSPVLLDYNSTAGDYSTVLNRRLYSYRNSCNRGAPVESLTTISEDSVVVGLIVTVTSLPFLEISASGIALSPNVYVSASSVFTKNLTFLV